MALAKQIAEVIIGEAGVAPSAINMTTRRLCEGSQIFLSRVPKKEFFRSNFFGMSKNNHFLNISRKWVK